MNEQNGNPQNGNTKEKANLAVLAPMPIGLGGLIPRSLDEAMQLAKVLAESRVLPAHLLGKPPDVLGTMLKGLELGLKPMVAFAEIYNVDGKYGCSAALMRAMCLSSPVCEYFQMVESTTTKCTYEAKRRGNARPSRVTYTIEQANAAGLSGKDNWKKHPAAMLVARASAALARMEFSDVVQGMQSLDELKEIEERVVSGSATVTPNKPMGQTVAPPAPSTPPASVVPEEPVEDDFDYSVPPPKPEEKKPDAPQAEEKPKSSEPTPLEKVLIQIAEATDGKHLEALMAAIKALPKTDQFAAKKAYSEKRDVLVAGSKAS